MRATGPPPTTCCFSVPAVVYTFDLQSGISADGAAT